MTDDEMTAILADQNKRIRADIAWSRVPRRRRAWRFRVPVSTEPDLGLAVEGWVQPARGQLNYTVLMPGIGRIYALNFGHLHRDERGRVLADKHKHRWTERAGDRHAYPPDDITATAVEPGFAWIQFCAEAGLRHDGAFADPPPEPEA